MDEIMKNVECMIRMRRHWLPLVLFLFCFLAGAFFATDFMRLGRPAPYEDPNLKKLKMQLDKGDSFFQARNYLAAKHVYSEVVENGHSIARGYAATEFPLDYRVVVRYAETKVKLAEIGSKLRHLEYIYQQ